MRFPVAQWHKRMINFQLIKGKEYMSTMPEINTASKKMVSYGIAIVTAQGKIIPFRFGTPMGRLSVGDFNFLHECYMCFAKSCKKIDGGMTYFFKPVSLFTNEIRNDVLLFLDKYVNVLPALHMLKRQVGQLACNQYVTVVSVSDLVDQDRMMNVVDMLRTISGLPAISVKYKEWWRKYSVQFFGEHRIHIGHHEREDRVCRWCGMSMPVVTFKKKAHAISESLGNKNVVLNDECDECNNRFGMGIEASVSTFLEFQNVIFGIAGKNGIPKMKHGEQVLLHNDGNHHLFLEAMPDSVVMSGNIPSRVEVKSRVKIAYQDIFRGLCKYALSVVDDECFSRYQWLVPWLKNEVVFPRVPIVMDFDSSILRKQPQLVIHRKLSVEHDLPSLYCELHHATSVYGFIVPKDEKELQIFSDEKATVDFWRLTPGRANLRFKWWDMSSVVPEYVKNYINPTFCS